MARMYTSMYASPAPGYEGPGYSSGAGPSAAAAGGAGPSSHG